MKQYCRYCGHAVLQDEELFYCTEKEQIFDGAKARRINKCKYFGACGIDLFDPSKEYSPRKPKETNELQRNIFESEEDKNGNS